METIKASDFKAWRLAVLDRVSVTGESVVTLKRDRPVAEQRPVRSGAVGYPQSELAGTVSLVGDAVQPMMVEEEWEALRS
ncbi:MAG: type II toxin-antitoxin system prevent-host-death family antitoxin [Rhodospirillales bacterium]|nr:type II toxin-antitoxin system prevent-host-death family antitoxin [Rhodospirillales bacterium]